MMRTLLLYTCGVILTLSIAAIVTNNLSANLEAPSAISTVDNRTSTSNSFTNSKSSSLLGSSNYQKATISVKKENLGQPHMLKINSGGSKLKGEIVMNNQVIQEINDNKLEINLSPYLSKGEQILKVRGKYEPASSTVDLELSSPENNTIQQSSGTGKLDYQLTFNVQ
jgi:hypothetical protein